MEAIKFEELINLYKGIYKVTLEISKLIEIEDLEKISIFLDRRGILIDRASYILKNTVFSPEEKAEIESIKAKIKFIEKQNQENLTSKRDIVKKEFSQINIGHKMASAYKYTREIGPNILDYKE